MCRCVRIESRSSPAKGKPEAIVVNIYTQNPIKERAMRSTSPQMDDPGEIRERIVRRTVARRIA
jgi:hypothetical protein